MSMGGPILFLGDEACPLIDWLRQTESVIDTARPIDSAFVIERDIGFIVSYGYRHILSAEVLACVPDRAINLHIALLPWNRGADPNLWSFIDNTPKGVTIHYIDSGIDTGDIIVQREVTIESCSTLATSYQQLSEAIEDLFKDNWETIRTGRCGRTPQTGSGSYHSRADRAAVQGRLENGWDTLTESLSAAALGSPES